MTTFSLILIQGSYVAGLRGTLICDNPLFPLIMYRFVVDSSQMTLTRLF